LFAESHSALLRAARHLAAVPAAILHLPVLPAVKGLRRQCNPQCRAKFAAALAISGLLSFPDPANRF